MPSVFDFHADDFALTAHSDQDIMTLLESGTLDSISVMPNMSGFPRACALLANGNGQFPYPKISVHLNFMEGKSLCTHSEVPHLTDEHGFFRISWGRLLIWNYNPFVRKNIRRELAAEIERQARAVIDSDILRGQLLRFDSHQHPHMIPLVFDALCDAIHSLSAHGFNTEFIRNARDSLFPYLKSSTFFCGFSPANFVKCMILNFFAHRVSRKLRKMRLDDNCICGVFFSGNMDAVRLKKVLPAFARLVRHRTITAEILFHPGTVLAQELGDEFTKAGFNEFHTSSRRKTEYESATLVRGFVRELTKEFFNE
ncbi:MAG: ChbG/HpnK family deacetylase [Treponemataceae bacterium]|nr:ChbG/HpnK family deacetylase [Treponemataceae bacterium]